MEKLIIKIKYGGLGDHLFYSHIPRIAKEHGYKEVLISNKSDFRNPDYKKLVWDYNPFINGFTDEDGISIENIKIHNEEDLNLLDKIMLGFGLDDSKRFHEPEIYYKPRVIAELQDKIIYDPNYISNAGIINSQRINKYFSINNIKPDYQLIIRGKNTIPVFKFGNLIRAKTFWDFIDIIYSAKEVYCFITGTATLAPAFGKGINVFYSSEMDKMFRHSKLNKYIKL